MQFQHLQIRFKQSLIPLLLLIGTTISVIPAGAKTLFYAFPSIDIMIIYFFTIYGRQWLSPVIVTFIGVYHDALYGQPLGITALGYLLFFVIVLTQRWLFSRQDALIAWLGFSLFAGVYFLFHWGLLSGLYMQFLPIRSMVLTWLLTASSYGVIHWICQKLLDYIELSKHAQST